MLSWILKEHSASFTVGENKRPNRRLLVKTQMRKNFSNQTDSMEHLGVRHDVISYNTLIGGHCLAGRTDEAAKLLDVMLSVGLKPNEWTYNTLLHGYCKARRIDDAYSLF